MDKTSLGDRMKAYENIERRYLPRRMDTILRVDGKAFHTFTRGFDIPYDESFIRCMELTALDLCSNIEGAKMAYHQSDEITVLITDNDTLETQPWYGKNIQKMVSIGASLATFYFNKHMREMYADGELSDGMTRAVEFSKTAIFDARVFVVPHEEVLNVFEWRQQDAIRNSIQAAGQTYFSHKELEYQSVNEIQTMLFKKKDINWNDYPTFFKRGSCIIKKPRQIMTPEGSLITRDKWVIDLDIPIFHVDPNYINDHIKWN